MLIYADWCSNKVQPGFLLLEHTSGVPPVIFVVRSYIHSLKDPFLNLKNVIYKKDKAGCRWQQGTFVDGEIMKMALIMAALPWIGEQKKIGETKL